MSTLAELNFESRLPATLALLQELVDIDSPSTEKPAVDRLALRLADLLSGLGGRIEIIEKAAVGNQLLFTWGSGEGGALALCHLDTVFQAGTAAARPFFLDGDRASGPGVLDMKGGIAMLVGVLQEMSSRGIRPARPIKVLFTSDEEIGSLESREIIEREAARAEIVYCLEPGLPDGAVKTVRRGTGEITIHTYGIAAHAGADHEKGRNAIEELAHHILSVQRLTDYRLGTTVNVGLVRGGTRPNVVPEEATAVVDFRVSRAEEVGRLREWVDRLAPVIPGARVAAALTVNRPPMPRDERMAQTYARAREIAAEIGIDLKEGGTGGASDANFVAPLGVSVLDGLGAVGEGAHSDREYIRVSSLPGRMALLANLLLRW